MAGLHQCRSDVQTDWTLGKVSSSHRCCASLRHHSCTGVCRFLRLAWELARTAMVNGKQLTKRGMWDVVFPKETAALAKQGLVGNTTQPDLIVFTPLWYGHKWTQAEVRQSCCCLAGRRRQLQPEWSEATAGQSAAQ